MEEWKDIIGYEGLYQISNLGNVKSLYRLDNMGRLISERILSGSKDKKGYLIITLSNNGIQKKYKNHRLLCLHFVKNIDNKKEINHINGIKDDNTLKNLEWVTTKENAIHRFKVLGHKGSSFGKFGKDNPSSKKVNQYNLYGNFIKTWDCITNIERKLKIYRSSIIKVCKGKQNTAGGFIWKYKKD